MCSHPALNFFPSKICTKCRKERSSRALRDQQPAAEFDRDASNESTRLRVVGEKSWRVLNYLDLFSKVH